VIIAETIATGTGKADLVDHDRILPPSSQEA
jgi:hypothetical protein